MKTNIYLFTNQDQSTEYGRGTYFRQMIECFHKNETISLHIVQLFTDESEFKITQQENVEIITFPVRYVPFQSIERYYRNSWYILKKYIRTQEEDQLIFHLNFVHQYQLVKYMRNDFPGCKVFFTLHFQQWASTLSGNDISYKKIIRESSSLSFSPIEQEIYNHFLFEKRVLEGVDKTICLSRFTENLLKETYGLPEEKIQFIPNGLADNFPILSLLEKKKLKKKLFIPDNEKIILYVGRLDSSKGIDLLLAAFRDLLSNYSDCRLILIGDGDISGYMNQVKGIWNKITFTGKLNKEELYTFYQIADLGVLPSHHEQCSYVAIEMMGFQLPIISSSAHGLQEMISPYTNGKIIDLKKGDDKSISKFTKTLLNALENKEIKRSNFPTSYHLDPFKKNYKKLYEYEVNTKSL